MQAVVQCVAHTPKATVTAEPRDQDPAGSSHRDFGLHALPPATWSPAGVQRTGGLVATTQVPPADQALLASLGAHPRSASRSRRRWSPACSNNYKSSFVPFLCLPKRNHEHTDNNTVRAWSVLPIRPAPGPGCIPHAAAHD